MLNCAQTMYKSLQLTLDIYQLAVLIVCYIELAELEQRMEETITINSCEYFDSVLYSEIDFAHVH